jgi:hypothetical protein
LVPIHPPLVIFSGPSGLLARISRQSGLTMVGPPIILSESNLSGTHGTKPLQERLHTPSDAGYHENQVEAVEVDELYQNDEF